MGKKQVLIVLLFITTLFIVAGCTETGGKKGIETYFSGLNSESNYLISPNSFVKMLEANSSEVYLLDIRKKEDYHKGHIPSAEHCWWFDVDKIIPELPKDKTIVIYCYSGQSAGQIVGVLRTAGYEAVSLTGGWNNGWKPYLEAQGDYTCPVCDKYQEIE